MKNATPKLDTTPTVARQVIELYASELADVVFPDLDLSTLQSAQSELHAAQLEIERIEDELAEARAQHEERIQALSTKTERALAYARIFAQGDTTLAPRVAEIGRKKPLAQAEGSAAEPPAKKRGRKPRAEAPSELFSEAAAQQAS